MREPLNGYYNEKLEADLKKKNKKLLTPIILMVALGVHSIFEGIALGLMQSYSSSLSLGLAILIHKWAEAMSISVSFIKSAQEVKTIIWFMVVFAILTPLGTLLGMFTANFISTFWEITLMSIAAGTFLYVSCQELIVEAFTLPGNRWFKLLAFAFGILLAFCVLFIDHS